MTYATKNIEILDLFKAAGKEIPHEDSDLGRAVSILTTICDSQGHTIPENTDDDEFFVLLKEIESKIGESDFTIDFDGNEYRIIKDSDIWEIYVDAIKDTVEDCYSDVLKLDKIPSFIAVTIDWEQTAQNAFVDGYGHQFSSYDGSEEEAAGYWIFRTN